MEIGLAELGISDHNPMPEYFDDWRMLIGDFPAYLALVEEARARFPQFPIRLGLECDFLEGRESWIEETAAMANWDYLIGSVHYLAPGWDMDNPKHLSRWKTEADVEEIWETYWRMYERCVRSRMFDFYAHPDLAKKFGLRPAGDLQRYYEPVIQAFVDTGAVMEVSTAGLHKEVAEIYPAQGMVEMAFAAGVPVVINSDAHAVGEVGRDFDQALKSVRAAGYRETVRFCKRERSVVTLPEAWPVG